MYVCNICLSLLVPFSLFLSQSVQANLFSALHSIVLFARFHFILGHWFRDHFDLRVCMYACMCVCESLHARHTWMCISVNTHFLSYYLLPFLVLYLSFLCLSLFDYSTLKSRGKQRRKLIVFFLLPNGENRNLELFFRWCFFASHNFFYGNSIESHHKII